MNKNSKLFTLLNRYKKDLIAIVVIFTTFKVIATVALFFLPTKSIEFVEERKKENFYLFNLPRAIAISQEKVVVPKKKEVKKTGKTYSLKELTLKAVYAENDGKGFILVLDKSNQSQLISHGEKYKEYLLTKILPKKAIFTKNRKEYVLELKDDSGVKFTSVKESKKKQVEKKRNANRANTIQLKDRVAKKEIEKYKKNLNLIWRNIKIQPHYEGKQIKGFNIEYVKRGSVFEQLGLQAGDRLIKGNGMELKSVKDAFTLYKQIDKIKVFKLTILRNGNEEELEYEVY